MVQSSIKTWSYSKSIIDLQIMIKAKQNMFKQEQSRDDKNLENRGQGKANMYYLSDLYVTN